MLNNPEYAYCFAQQAYDEAVEALDTLDEDNYKDSTLIM